MTRALLIPAGDIPREVEVDGLDDLQRAVDGHIEALSWLFPGSGISIYANDEAKLRGDLAPNRAVYLSDARLTNASPGAADDECVDIVCGNAIAVGFDEDTGEDVDLSDKQVAMLRQRFGSARSIMSGIVELMRIRSAQHR